MRAFIIGGTGLVGRAAARRLLAQDWQVELVGRDQANVPADLIADGAIFHQLDRDDFVDLSEAFDTGADLLLDTVCFTGRQAEHLVPLARDATSTVLISSKAVYVDAAGRHSNSPEPADFGGPITEDQPTLPPGDLDYRSRAGYGPNKVAAELALLDSGVPVTVLRPSKIHGEGARPPREWIFVRRVLDRRPVVLFNHGGRGGDHPSSSANLAALIEHAAHHPGQRILNAADPDAPSAPEIAALVARHFGHHWQPVLLPDDAPPELGWHPWNRRPAVVLDVSAAGRLGYQPVGDYASTVAPMLDWLASNGPALPAGFDDGYFDGRFDYAAEDAYLTGR